MKNPKKTVLFVLLFLVAGAGYSREVQIGDSLKELMQGLSESDLLGADDLGLWPENVYYMYQKGGLRILLSMNYYPFGVLTQEGGSWFLLTDLDGDSLLDVKSSYLFIPPWIVGLNSTGINSRTDITEYLENMKDAFQSDSAPAETEEMVRGTEWLVETAQNTGQNDRYYAYLAYLYNYLYSRGEYGPALYCLDTLSSSMEERNETLLVYYIELAMKMGETGLARQADEMLVLLFPEFVPGTVYKYLLSTEGEEQKELFETLVNEHSQHWLVKEKILKDQ